MVYADIQQREAPLKFTSGPQRVGFLQQHLSELDPPPRFEEGDSFVAGSEQLMFRMLRCYLVNCLVDRRPQLGFKKDGRGTHCSRWVSWPTASQVLSCLKQWDHLTMLSDTSSSNITGHKTVKFIFCPPVH